MLKKLPSSPLLISALLITLLFIAALAAKPEGSYSTQASRETQPVKNESPAAAPDQTPEVKKQETKPTQMTLTVTPGAKDKKRFLVFRFSSKMVFDSEVYYQNLPVDQWPFIASRPIEANVFWADGHNLYLDMPQSPLDMEKDFSAAPLKLTWKSDLHQLNGNKLNYRVHLGNLAQTKQPRSYIPESPGIAVSLGSSEDTAGLKDINIALEPAQVVPSFQVSGTQARVGLTFNRIMVDSKQIRKNLNPGQLPLLSEPSLPWTGFWQDFNYLSMQISFNQKEFWDKISDIPYTFRLKEGFKSLNDEKFDLPVNGGKPILFQKFNLVNISQAGLTLEEDAELDLTFNKPINSENIKNALKAEVAPPAEKLVYKPAEVELVSVGGPGDEYNTVARVKFKAPINSQVNVSLNDMKSADGRGSISSFERNVNIHNYFTIAGSSSHVEDHYPWQPYFLIKTREPILSEDLENFVKVEPPLEHSITLGSGRNQIRVNAPFNSKSEINVTLLPGLRSAQGVLTKEIQYQVKLPEYTDKKLIFTGRGRYLSPQNPLLVKIAGRNADMVRLQAWRIYENNLPVILNTRNYDSGTKAKLTLQLSDNIVNKTSEVLAPAGEKFERLIDLRHLMEGKPNGAYLLKVTGLDKPKEGQDADEQNQSPYYDYDEYRHSPDRYLPVMISDIGLSARTLPGRLNIMALSLGKAEPVSGGQVKVYDSANQILAQGATDHGGLFSAAVSVNDVSFFTVEKDGDLNYLAFNHGRTESYYGYDDDDYYYDGNRNWFGSASGSLSVSAPESGFGPMRGYLTRGYEAFLFMPRDMFKPGETIKVKAMVRDKNIMPPEKPFPLIWRVTDPRGRIMGQGKTEMSAQGGLDFAYETPFSGRTGQWTAAVYLPESSSPLGQVKFTVEDFVPPRLKIDLKANKTVYTTPNPEVSVSAEASYLFGAPGSGLAWEVDASVSPASFRPDGWSGFSFYNGYSGFQSTRQRRAAQGVLDENGRAEIKYQPQFEATQLPDKLTIDMTVSVQEDGGRWNAKRISMGYFPRPVILGARLPGSAPTGQPVTFEAAAVTPDGKAAEVKNLKAEVFRIEQRYYSTFRNGRYFRQMIEDLSLETEQQLELAEGKGSVSFTPKAAGRYELRLSGLDDKDLRLTRRLLVHGTENAEPVKETQDVVEVSLDKAAYKPGEIAKIKVRAPFNGRLWLTMDTDENHFSQTFEMDEKEKVFNVQVSRNIKNNAQVSATVVSPLGAETKGLREVGTASLEIDREVYRLNVTADMPTHIRPSAKAPVIIRLTDQYGKPVAGEATVSLVDEGILSLSGFKTPDPWKMFVAGRYLMTSFFDLYGQLLPLEKIGVPFLIPGGGDGVGGEDGLYSPFRRKQEMLSIFLATVQVDESGQAVVELDVPEYSGRGRLMVVAAGKDKFGSAGASIKISRDLTAEPTVPLALAPGDEFEIPVRLFLANEAAPEAGRGVTLNIITEGPIKLIEAAGENSFELKPGQGETRIFKAIAKPSADGEDQAGVGKLIIESRDGLNEQFRQVLETVVRPPFPRVTRSVGLDIRKAETSIKLPTEGFLKGTAKASVSIGKSPAIEAARAVEYLHNYPHGCLEQTTSRAWIFVAAPDLMAGREESVDKNQHIRQGLNAAVQRLATMQGPGGGFSYWPDSSGVYEWGTVYAAHLLTEASRKTELPPGLLERSLTWLKAYLAGSYSNSDHSAAYILSTRAYACYVLALNGQYQAGWINTLKDRYEGLTPSGRIFLAGAEAIHKGNSEPLAELEKRNESLELNTLGQRVSSLESHPRNLALKLLAWSEVDPLAETTRDLALKVAEQGRRGWWSNTQENGLAALSLGNYLAKSGTGKPYQATLGLPGGKVILKGDQRETAVAGPNALAQSLETELILSIEGQGRPYCTITASGVPETAPEAKSAGLHLKRIWTLEDGKEINLSKGLAEPLKVAQGDKIFVTLELSADKSLQNIVLADLTPGGFEIENPRLIPMQSEDGQEIRRHADSAPRLQIREDRLIVIEPWIGGYPTKYSYTLRAVTPGRYIVPPTTAEGMYEPDRQVILPPAQVEVTAK